MGPAAIYAAPNSLSRSQLSGRATVEQHRPAERSALPSTQVKFGQARPGDATVLDPEDLKIAIRQQVVD